MIIRSRAPVRVDFAGGWTDVSIFAAGAGGMVVNAAIQHYVAGRMEIHDSEEDPAAIAPDASRPQEGLTVSYQSDLPSGSGLGTSSALNVVWLSLVKSQITSDEDRGRIAELAYDLETILGILGGKQDQYAAAYGGFNAMTFSEDVAVERLHIAPEMVHALESQLVLCYTGKPRLSGNIHENVWGAFRRGASSTVNALYSLRQCAVEMREALIASDTHAFAEILNRNWESQKALDPSVTNTQIEELFTRAASAGSVGGKACGAGGGGCLLFFAGPRQRDALASALAQTGVRIIPFRFDFEGLQVTRE